MKYMGSKARIAKYISILRPGRQLGEDGEYYQITIERVND